MGVLDKNLNKRIHLEGNTYIMDRFPALVNRNVLGTEGGIQKAVTSKDNKNVLSVLCNKGIPLRIQGKAILSYGAECWAMRMEDERKMKTTFSFLSPPFFFHLHAYRPSQHSAP